MKSLMCLFLLLVIAAFAGCASTDKTMESWLGYHQSDLTARWGHPKQVLNDGQGGMIFMYPARSCASAGTTYGSAYTTYGSAAGHKIYNPQPNASYKAYRMFWIDSNGRIYRSSSKGL